MAARPSNESGAILIVFMVTLAVAAIALGAAVQAWSTTWRRENEEELIFRGNQYVDGIIAYRKEHGGQFPLTLEDLFKPGPRRLRYIRRLYKDPIVPDGKWGLLYLMPGGQGVDDPKAPQGGIENGKESVSEPTIGWPIIGVISRAIGKASEDTYKIYKGHEHVDEWQFQVFDRGEQIQQPGNPAARPAPVGAGPGYGGKYPTQGIMGDQNRRGPMGMGGPGAQPGWGQPNNWPPSRTTPTRQDQGGNNNNNPP